MAAVDVCSKLHFDRNGPLNVFVWVLSAFGQRYSKALSNFTRPGDKITESLKTSTALSFGLYSHEVGVTHNATSIEWVNSEHVCVTHGVDVKC